MIDILIPTLGRSHVLADLAENIMDTTPLPHHIVFVVDFDDVDSWNALEEFTEPVICDGSYPVKINAGYRATGSEYVLPTADDVKFYPDWLENALQEFSDPSINVVGTDDLSPSTADRSHATMPIIRRSYIDRPGAAWNETGTVFHEGYRHNYVETETCQLAQYRNTWAFATGSVIEHNHPAWGKRTADDTDRKGNEQGWTEDEPCSSTDDTNGRKELYEVHRGNR
jgi:glycosyltransferase involved in cell wall biosynthesis